MEPIGAKIAEGRDSELFEHGPGKVLRLARDRRSLVAEAEIMSCVRSHDYPCPARRRCEVSIDGSPRADGRFAAACSPQSEAEVPADLATAIAANPAAQERLASEPDCLGGKVARAFALELSSRYPGELAMACGLG